jgi:hypothetical protein
VRVSGRRIQSKRIGSRWRWRKKGVKWGELRGEKERAEE